MMDYNWGIKECPDKSTAWEGHKFSASLGDIPTVTMVKAAMALEILLSSVQRQCGLMVAPKHPGATWVLIHIWPLLSCVTSAKLLGLSVP